MTDAGKTAKIADITKRAADYTAHPHRGEAAGYAPEQQFGNTPREIGRPNQRLPTRSKFAAWLYAIARRDLKPNSWRIDEGMGEGPAGAQLVIF